MAERVPRSMPEASTPSKAWQSRRRWPHHRGRRFRPRRRTGDRQVRRCRPPRVRSLLHVEPRSTVPPEVQPAAPCAPHSRAATKGVPRSSKPRGHYVMSRTIKFAKAGGPEVLEFLETEVPAPGPSEVRIKVKAIGINRAESMWRTDMYIEPVKFPAGLGYEAVGFVDSVGRDVSGVAVGDEVNVIPSFSMNQYHTYGEVILVPDYAVVKHPKSLSFAEARSE